MGYSILASRGFSDPELPAIFSEASEIAKRHSVEPAILATLYGKWTAISANRGFESALPVAEELLTRATQAGKPQYIAYGYFSMGILRLHTGSIPEAYKEMGSAISALAVLGDIGALANPAQVDTRVASLCQAARAAWLIGRFDDSARRLESGLALSEKLDSPKTGAYARAMAATIHLWDENFQTATDYAQQALDTAVEWGYRQEQVWAIVILHSAGARLRQDGPVRLRAHQAVEAYEEAGCFVALTELKAMVAHMDLATGEIESGIRMVDSGLADVSRLGEKYFVPDLMRLKAEILHARGDYEGAIEAVREAANLSRLHGNIAFELKAYIVARQIARSSDAEVAAVNLRECLDRMPDGSANFVRRALGSLGRSTAAPR